MKNVVQQTILNGKDTLRDRIKCFTANSSAQKRNSESETNVEVTKNVEYQTILNGKEKLDPKKNVAVMLNDPNKQYLIEKTV